MDQQELLKKIGQILDKVEIRYIITGGYAVIVWGRPRFTADIDIIIELLPSKIKILAAELLAIDKDVYISQEAMREALERRGEFNFIHPDSGIKVDFWVLKNDFFDKERLKRRQIKKIGGRSIYFISPEDLILSKLLWFEKSKSTRHLEDIESVFKIQKKLDLNYLKKMSKAQSTFGLLASFLEK